MACWEVDWNKAYFRKVRDNSRPGWARYWTYGGYVVAATPTLARYIGEPQGAVRGALSRLGMSSQWVSADAVPRSVEYHVKLLANCNAVLDLLDRPPK